MTETTLKDGFLLYGAIEETDAGKSLLLLEQSNTELYKAIDQYRLELDALFTIYNANGYELVADSDVPSEVMEAMRNIRHMLIQKGEGVLKVKNFARSVEEIQRWQDVMAHVDLSRALQAEHPTNSVKKDDTNVVPSSGDAALQGARAMLGNDDARKEIERARLGERLKEKAKQGAKKPKKKPGFFGKLFGGSTE